MAPRMPKRPNKTSNIKKASALDTFLAIQPHLQDIINYGAHGTAALGAGALGYMGNKARKMVKENDKGYRNGGCIMAGRGGKFKGIS
jgi:hypothetical protein